MSWSAYGIAGACVRGWEGALDAEPARWAARAPGPRNGNHVEVLVDGARALGRSRQSPHGFRRQPSLGR